jgi:hypothetical protein
MVGQVRPSAASRAIAKSGGAAAQRRLNYQMAMTKLQTTKGGEQLLSPKKPSGMQQLEALTPNSPTPSQQTPMEFPSMAGDGSAGSGGKSGKKGKDKFSFKKGKKLGLAAQEVSDIDFEGTEPIRTPTTSATSGSGSAGSGMPKKKQPNDIDWGVGNSDGWPAFDSGNTAPASDNKDIFVDNDGFFPNNAFSPTSAPPADGFASPVSTTSKSSKQRISSGGSSVGGTKKSSRDGKKLSSSRSKKEGDPERTRKKEKDKAAKKKTRTTTLSM